MKNIVVVVLSLAFSLALIEAFLMWRPEFQALVPFSELVFCVGPPHLGQAHELFGWTAVPDSAYFEQTSEADGWAVHIYNADGFRDLYNSGNEHVIVLGDSFTQGDDANNDEAFPHLLDMWNPQLAFHNFGTGGYGTKNSLSVYQFYGPRMPHRLVILAYFLGNDLRDNLSVSDSNEPRAPSNLKEGKSWREILKQVNSQIRQHLRTYNILYSFVREFFGGFDLSHEQVEKGVQVTQDLLNKLVRKTRANASDLLVVALPSWNQINNYRDQEEIVQQRTLLNKLPDEWDNVYLIDMTDTIAHRDAKKVYGIKNKHFSRYGYYLTAKAIHDWINFEWSRGPAGGKEAPPFQPPSGPVKPDCALMPAYREAFAHPVALDALRLARPQRQ